MLNRKSVKNGEKRAFPISALARLLILLGFFGLSWLNAKIPILRFDAETVWNDVFNMIVFAVFPMLAVNFLYFKGKLFKWSGMIIFSLLTIALLPVYIFGALDIQQFLNEGRTFSTYRLDQIKTDGHTISIYRIGGGGLGKNWTLIRQEKKLFSKLFVVSDLYKESEVEKIDVRVVDADTIEINILLNKRYDRREWTAFHLKKFVYL